MSDLAELIEDELYEFAKHHQLTVDDDGFVSGNVLPADVLSLGYILLAWTLTTQMYKNVDKKTINDIEEKINIDES